MGQRRGYMSRASRAGGRLTICVSGLEVVSRVFRSSLPNFPRGARRWEFATLQYLSPDARAPIWRFPIGAVSKRKKFIS